MLTYECRQYLWDKYPQRQIAQQVGFLFVHVWADLTQFGRYIEVGE